VEIFAGFAGAEVLYDAKGAVRGVATGDMGVNRKGEKTDAFQPGVELLAKYTFFAEGCRGHLGKQLEARFKLREGVDPQVFGIGLKELWEVRPEQHRPGLVVHTAGWPLDSGTYGGSFLYHLDNHQAAVGFVVGLGYTNPYLAPHEEFQRYKTHPAIRGFLEGGKRVAYGARAITAGGLQSLPKLVFPGGCLIGDDAGFLNASRIKGSHGAIKSGMMAAEAAHAALASGRSAWRSSPASPAPKCSTTRKARCAASPPATWASTARARRPRPTSREWSCSPNTPSLPKAAAAIWASSWSTDSGCATESIRSCTA